MLGLARYIHSLQSGFPEEDNVCNADYYVDLPLLLIKQGNPTSTEMRTPPPSSLSLSKVHQRVL